MCCCFTLEEKEKSCLTRACKQKFVILCWKKKRDNPTLNYLSLIDLTILGHHAGTLAGLGKVPYYLPSRAWRLDVLNIETNFQNNNAMNI